MKWQRNKRIPMGYHWKNPHFYLMLLGDALCFVLALFGAYALRFEFNVSGHLPQALRILVWILPAKVAFFYIFGLYRGMWRYSSVEDMWRLLRAVLAVLLFVTAVLGLVFRYQGFSRAVFILDAALTFLFAGSLRMGIRSWYGMHTGTQGLSVFGLAFRRHKDPVDKSVLIIGAGAAGEKILREIIDNPALPYRVVGFLDDNPHKQGRTLRGVPVLGSVDHIDRIVEKFPVDKIFIATPSATGSQMRHIMERCKATGLPFKTLPALGAILDGKVSVKLLRDVKYQDLLRRQPVQLDMAGIKAYVKGKRVLVTGAGGSIGSELCRQLVSFQPARMVLVDAGEANLHSIQMLLHYEVGFTDYTCVLGRVQDEALMAGVFAAHQPEVVFHAAAYKHVPMLERNPWEAVFNNIRGTQVVLQLSARFGVDRFVLVSTDKAVRPTNVMGASKRVAELLLQSFQGGAMRSMAVRFGNVIGSSGSVVPLFLSQIERGGPVTVTHPEVTRYFLTIPEAAQLILQAGALGKGGEIFLLQMGTPIKILDLARDLIRLSGKLPDVDIDIAFTGLREGEKLFEELLGDGEDVVQTIHDKIMVLRSDNGKASNCSKVTAEGLHRHLDELYRLAALHQAWSIRCKLREIVPDYTPQDCGNVLCRCELPESKTAAIDVGRFTR